MSIFSKIPFKKPSYSTFNLSHDRKFSLNMGDLVPCYLQEVLPGDRIKMGTQQMLRMMPMIHPIMHEVQVDLHYFFVPNRLVWQYWPQFISGGESGMDEYSMIHQNVDYKVEVGSLADYMGLPLGNVKDFSIIPFLIYQLVYNEYYRDQNLELDIWGDYISDNERGPVKYEGGANYNVNTFGHLFKLRKRAWQHDYFTSALPFAQKGEVVKLPVFSGEDLIPITYDARNKTTQQIRNLDGTDYTGLDHQLSSVNGVFGIDSNPDEALALDVSKQHWVDPEDATAAASSIKDLRQAFKLQEWLEKTARSGNRYVEMLLAHFGVHNNDLALGRPKYLGGNSSPVMFSEVLQTSQTQDTALGEMAGHGLNVGRGFAFNERFTEHGFVIALMSVRPKTAYQQGLPKHFSKFDKFDYFWKEFEHIGEQEIYNKELIYTDKDDYNNGIFGYIPRYAEYKYNPSSVHGYMKDNLSAWHLGRVFDPANPPALNEEFIKCNPRKDIFAVTDEEEHSMICQMFHNIEAKRPMTYYSSPKF